MNSSKTTNRKPSGKSYISPSQISTYSRCGEQYRFRYIEKMIIPPGIAQVRGQSVHKGAQYNFDQKVETRQDMKPEQVIDYSVSTFEDTIKHEGVDLKAEEVSRGKSVVISEFKDQTVQLAELMIKQVAPKHQPVLVEKERIIELPSSTRDLKGIIDLKVESGSIVDLKTSKKSWNQNTLDRDLQFTFYGMMEHAETGEDTKPMILENLVATKDPRVNTLTTERTMADYERLINRINRIVDSINKGIYNPAPVDSWACSENWCGYWHICKLRPRR